MSRLACLLFAAANLAVSAPAIAAPPALSAAIQPLGFLVGRWTAKAGHAENGTLAKGVSTFEPTAGGAALLRQDRTDLSAPDGKPLNSFEQVMLIYPEGGALHADYFDGTHVIHYVSSVVDPGKSVTFDTAPTPGPPRFRLSYRAVTPTLLAVRFEMAPPGAADFHTIAEGEAVRD